MTAQVRKHAVEPDDIAFDVAADVLKLLADPTRLRIVWALLHGEHSVNELADHVGARPPAVSQHLAKLRAADLVRVRRDGNRIFYAARNEHIEHLAAEALLHADHLVAGGRHHHTASQDAHERPRPVHHEPHPPRHTRRAATNTTTGAAHGHEHGDDATLAACAARCARSSGPTATTPPTRSTPPSRATSAASAPSRSPSPCWSPPPSSKLVIVVVTGSVALLADTIHNFSDALTAIPLFIAFRLGRRAANRRYTYGYRRAEDLAGLFVARR